MKTQGRKKFYDDESPSKRVRWISPQIKPEEHDSALLSASLQISQELNINNSHQQQVQHNQKCIDINKDLVNNKQRLMNFLVDNNIEFEQLNPNQYAATIKLINTGKSTNPEINQAARSLSPMKVSSSQGYYAEKDKQHANMAQMNKSNKQPFISAVLNDIKAKDQPADLHNTFNLSIAADPSVDQNQRFLHFLDEKLQHIQRELTNAEQLLSIHNTNSSIKQLRDSHSTQMNVHKKLCAIYLRSPQEFRNKCIQYLRPIQSTIAQGNYTNLRNNSDLEILYALLQKLLLDNCDAQTMEEFVDQQIKLQACELYTSNGSGCSGQLENLTQSYSSLKNSTKRIGSAHNLDNHLDNSIMSGRQKNSKNLQKGNKKLIIIQETTAKSSSPSKRSKRDDNNRSFSSKRQDLNTSSFSKRDDQNKSFLSKKDDLNRSFSSKKGDKQSTNISSLQSTQPPSVQINNKKIFSYFGNNGKIKSNSDNKDPKSKGTGRNSLNYASLSSTTSSLKESLQLGKTHPTNNQNNKLQPNKQNSKFSLSTSSLKFGNSLTIDNIYHKNYKSANSQSTHWNDSLTDHSYSQSTTNKKVGNFDFSQAISQQSNRSSSNKNRQGGSVLNSFYSNRINTENTPKSNRANQRRNSRSLSPSKAKLNSPPESGDNTTSSRRLMKASEMQKQYDNSRTSSPSRRKVIAASQTTNQRLLRAQDFQKEYEKILLENFEALKQSYSKNQIVGQVNEKIIQEEFSKSLKILNQNFHLLSSEELINYYDFISNKAQILYKQFMKKNQFW